jgi:cellobiose transport system permease protein
VAISTASRSANQPVNQPVSERGKKSGGRLWRTSPLTYGALIFAGLLSIYPFYYVVVIATRSQDTINDPTPPVSFGGSFWDNFNRVLEKDDVNFMQGVLNSLIVASVVTLSVVLTSTLAGFAFAKLKFKGSNALLLTVLITMMVPTQLGLIPLWSMMLDFDWFDTLWAVTIPFLTSAFGVFMMRQYITSAVPDELIEAARVDGCSTFRTYFSVVLPAVLPAAGVLALLTFMEQWNSFFWPRAILTPDNPTLQVSLGFISYGYYTDYSMVFAATAVATLPLVVVFIVFGRQIISGIMEGAVKA